jgi:hypothetical protein
MCAKLAFVRLSKEKQDALQRARYEMQEALKAQKALKLLPVPSYVSPIGAYADDAPDIHESFLEDDGFEQVVSERKSATVPS